MWDDWILCILIGILIIKVIRTQNLSNTEADECDHIESNDLLYMRWLKDNKTSTFRQRHVHFIQEIMNRTADPCEDFYEYACGNYRKANPAPNRHECDVVCTLARRQRYILYEAISSLNQENLTGAELKLKKLYTSCMDSDTIESRGYGPLFDFMNKFSSWPFLDSQWSNLKFDWINITAHARLYMLDIFFHQRIMRNFSDSNDHSQTYYQIHLLGLDSWTHVNIPDEDIRLCLRGLNVSNERMEDLLVGFRNFDANLSSFTGPLPIIPSKRISLDILQKTIPEIDFRKFLSTIQNRELDGDEEIHVKNLEYFKKLANLIKETDPQQLAIYIYVNMCNQLRIRVFMPGNKDLHILTCNRLLPEMDSVLSSIYVKILFNEKILREVEEISESIRDAARKAIEKVDWIDESTKKIALNRLQAIVFNIGYTDFLTIDEINKKYADLDFNETLFFENVMNLERFRNSLDQQKTGRPVNKSLEAFTLNASYERGIVIIPAAFVQAPFFHSMFPKFVNYGTIGQAIAHEIVHNFDMKHLKVSANIPNANSTAANILYTKFSERLDCFRFEYEETSPTIDLIINENVADTEGLKLAFNAFKNWKQQHQNDPEQLDMNDYAALNMTHEQLFFVMFAQNECGGEASPSTEGAITETESLSHRGLVINSISKYDQFAKSFNCPVNSAMNQKKKCFYFV